MIYKFHAFGHHNILASHKTTMEFTKDEDLSLKGDCIVGVKADFDMVKLKKFIKNANSKKITITIETSDKKIKETVNTELNTSFNHGREMVIRTTDFSSERTLGIKANKAAFNLDRHLISFLKQKNNKISVIIENNG